MRTNSSSAARSSKKMDQETLDALEAKGVTLDRDSTQALGGRRREGVPGEGGVTMILLRLRAPFAAFRPLHGGVVPADGRIPHPVGRLRAGLEPSPEIETRRDDGLSAMTVTRFGLPPARIAIGADPNHPLPAVQTIFQQLHNYPVGASGKERKDDAKGNKYNITPVRREFLSGLHAVVAIDFHRASGRSRTRSARG